MAETDDFGKHEVFHTASIIVDMIATHILEHQAVEANPRWKYLAQKALDAMMFFYQETATDTALRDMLKEMIIAKSYKKGDFTLASGQKSKYFFDLKPTMLDAQGINLIGGLLLEKITDIDNQGRGEIMAVGGMATGAIPLVSIVSAKSYQSNSLDAFFVRQKQKDHGTEQSMEGGSNIEPGSRVTILEDVTTTGGSAMIAVNVARKAGFYVDAVITVVDRLEGARENLVKEEIDLYSLFTTKDFDDGV